MYRLVLGLILLCCSLGRAAVTGMEVIERADVAGGNAFGSAGPYEKVVARVNFAVDPKLPANRIISDIDLAPRDENGLVHFSADLYVLKPRDPARGNGTVLFEVVNRGNKLMLGSLNLADPGAAKLEPELGDGLLLDQGYTLVWLGWQWDVPREPGLLRLYAPPAKSGDRPIRGLVRSEFVPDRAVRNFQLGDRNHVAYVPVSPDDHAARLTVRATPEAEPTVIPRSQWRFAREENGVPVADSSRVYLAAGFQPGKIYEVVYTAPDPVLVGLGPAAIRDLISYLKYESEVGGYVLLGDQSQHIKRALGFGISQSGRFLRTFVYQGFNQDEQKRQVFDGLFVQVAGAGRGSFNHRFAQPSRDGHPFLNILYPTDLFPFTDLDETDSETGLSDGLLARARQAGVVPKIFYVNSAYEYWGRAEALAHTSPDGERDWPIPDSSRIYFIAGAQHGSGTFPPHKTDTQYLPDPLVYREPLRALITALNAWVAEGKEPPASRYPKLSDGTLTTLPKLTFPHLPGVEVPAHPRTAWRLDFGPQFQTEGVVSLEPPKLGRPFPLLVPQVDSDGNDLAGIRLPEIQAPLATYTGWNLRAPEIGAPDQIYSMAGSFFPFARTSIERAKNGDPRPSIQERYRSREEYLDRISAAAKDLVRQGYLLPKDVTGITERARREWDYLTGAQ